MNKYIKYCFLMLALPVLVGCSDEEEILEPSVGVVDNKFAVPDDATGFEADLRRQFYKDTGCFLIFSDLLNREYLGKDANGNDIYKDNYLDFRYNMTSVNSVGPEFVFLDDDEEKSAAASLLMDYINPHVEGGSLMPFSILAVESLKRPKNGTYGDLVDANTVSCMSCLAIAVGEWLSLPLDQKDAYSKIILKDVVSSRFKYTSEIARPFRDLSYEYSSEYILDVADYWDREDLSVIYDLGYLSYVKSWRGPENDYLPYVYDDFDDYFDVLMDMSESEFMEMYGNYPKVVEKYNIMKDAVLSLGYKF